MSNLNVVAVIKAKVGSEDVIQEALNSLVEPTRAEAGCISYELYHSAADPTTFVTIEQWQAQSDLDAHMQTPHIAAALEAGADAFDGAPGIHPLRPITG
jgi:quinol monooxygenase YgiN